MKKLVAILSALIVPAQAHDSLVPHAHPHDLSMLPGTDVVAWALFTLAAALIVYWKFVHTP